jgi:hypothetical protein
LPTVDSSFTFAKYFNGYMIGAKLFKDFPAIVGVHTFKTSDSTTNSYFYYLFTGDAA